MSKRLTYCAAACVLAMAAAAGRGAAAEDGLAPMLPAETTVVYVRADVPGLVEAAQDAFAFVDPELAEALGYQTGELRDVLVELAANREFRPALFDRLTETQLAFVVMLMKEPERREHLVRWRDVDFDGGTHVPGEWQEKTVSQWHYFAPSFVIRAPDEETATDLFDQFVALLDRLHEKEPDNPEFERADVEVEEGRMITDGRGQATFGQLREYIVLSAGNPRELWAALMAPPGRTLADTELYARIMQAGSPSPFYGLVSLRAALSGLQAVMDGAVEQARSAAGDMDMTVPPPEDPKQSQQYFALKRAEAARTGLRVVGDALSLDRMEQAAFAVYADVTDDAASSEFIGYLSHSEPLSVIATELLDGSGEFDPPATGRRKGVCTMVRLNVAKVYAEIMATLQAERPDLAPQVAMATMVMQMRLGVGIEELLGLLASDFYVLVDRLEKEHEVTAPHMDAETGRWSMQTKTVFGPVTETVIMWGLEDPQRMHDVLAGAVNQLGANPQTAAFAGKRDYQGTDVFCFGPQGGDPNVLPDGRASRAMAVVGRHLAVGSWDDVTAAVRRWTGGEETDPQLMAAVNANDGANFLVVVPAEFYERMQQMVTEDEEKVGLRMVLEGLDDADLDFGDPGLEQRLRDALGALARTVDAMNEKAKGLNRETMVVSGRHEGAIYKVQSRSVIRK